MWGKMKALAAASVARRELAPAKVNLTLRVLGRRADGYHDLDSLVAFANIGDDLSFAPDHGLALFVRGPTAAASGEVADNLVLKAVRALAERIEGLELGHFTLWKRLPVAAGLGGGSADAAAALRLIARANMIPLEDERLRQAARATGADVPVCLDPQPRLMRGIGEVLSAPLLLPRLPVVLVNPGVSVATKDVFAALSTVLVGRTELGMVDEAKVPLRRETLIDFVREHPNDLEPAALALHPVVGDVLGALREVAGCRLARMSGSGATCFGLFDSNRAAATAARSLRAGHPKWWIRATVLARRSGTPPSMP
jgi:4-diphosphocytidyl-2-C-methyl-D-erythritol kinase